MLTLESLFEKYIRIMDKFSGFHPSVVTYPFEIQHLGNLDGVLFPIEIKINKTDFGWLYSKSPAISFRHLEQLYGVWRLELKLVSEELLKEKKYSDEPKLYHLVKMADGGITGYIHMMDAIYLAKNGLAEKENPQRSLTTGETPV